MIKKLNCLLVLCAFLLVKSGPLYALTFNQLNITHVADQQEEENPDDDSNRGERAETLDEDFTSQNDLAVPVKSLAKLCPVFTFPDTLKVYITLSNPPPDPLV
ncbi:hypothetical protein [Pedobacter caeni]|nr:hypothetical protein [Pedobacter caeni]